MAAPFIRQHAAPILVLFECFADFCEVADDAVLTSYPVLFTDGQWYNYYMLACTYPGDKKRLSSEKMFQDFIHGGNSKISLLFGGQFHQQCLASLPKEYASLLEQTSYNKGLMEYRGAFHPFIMPCGKMEAPAINQDELPLF